MSEYVYESGMSTHRRKQRRTAITLMLTLLLLFGAFWWAWSYIRDGDGAPDADATATPTPTETTATCVGPQDPKTITVHVYNSTQVPGLARRAADELVAAGFTTIGNVANDPLDTLVEVPIELRFGPPGRPYAETFRDAYVPEAVLSENVREGGGLDVVLGPGFTSFGEIPDLPPCDGG